MTLHRPLFGSRRTWLWSLLLLAALTLVPWSSAAEGATFLKMTSQPGDDVGGGSTYDLTAQAYSFSIRQYFGKSGFQMAVMSASDYWLLEFFAPSGSDLQPGPYEGARKAEGGLPVPGLNVEGGRGCSAITGRFVVLELAYAQDGSIERAAIDFEQHCGTPALFGSLRYNSDIDVTPRLSVAPAAIYEVGGEANALGFWISLSGPAVTPVSVAYSTKNGTARSGLDYTAKSGTVVFSPGQTGIRVDVGALANPASLASSAFLFDLGAATGAPVAFGSATGTILVPPSPTFVKLVSQPGERLGGGQAATFTPLDGPIHAMKEDVTGVRVTFDSGDVSGWSFDFMPPAGETLAPGVYEGITEAAFQSPARPGLGVTGGSVCDSATGRFVVLDLERGSGTEIVSLAVDFEFHCDGAAPALFGSIRYNSAAPVEERVSVAPTAVYEGDGEATQLTFPISLSQPANGTVTVDYQTADGTAVSGIDYTAVSGTAVFQPGQTVVAVSVPIAGTTVVKPALGFTLSLNGANGAAIAFGAATGTILNDNAGRTAIYLDGDVGAAWIPGRAHLLNPLGGAISAVWGPYSSAEVDYLADPGSTWFFGFPSASGAPFRAGDAGDNMRAAFAGQACGPGRFVVLEAQFGPSNLVQRLAVDFEFHCNHQDPAIFGSIRYNSTVPVTRCAQNTSTLCLGKSPFAVRAQFDAGGSGSGTAHAVGLTSDTGYLWFFSPSNVEAVIKVLDGCAINGHYWVFAGGLTNVSTTVRVVNGLTTESVVFSNPGGHAFQPYQNTSALACGPATLAALAEDAPRARTAGGREKWVDGRRQPTRPAVQGQAPSTCVPDSTTLCLNNGRYQVRTAWSTGSSASGQGQAVALTADTGYFWFFSPSNLEMVVKVINGCATNNHYWVFAGGLTNVEVTTTVVDTLNGSLQSYVNPVNTPFEPLQDTSAFPSCP